MRLACYCRYSSENQRDESIDAQIRAIYKWAEYNKHIIVIDYIDRALSGKTDDRPDFMKMINDSDKNIWDGIVVHKMDRFSRDKYDSVFYKKRLRDNGKKFFSVTENIGDDPSSVILESMLEGMAQYYVTNLAREVKKGLNENAYNCKYNGGTPPLGYDIDKTTQKYIINEKESKIIREIFSLYLSGKSLLDIAVIMNEKGYTTKRGNKFGKNSLFDILGNERYTGTYIYNQSIKSNKRVKNENIIKIDDGMPQIISKKDFQKVIDKRKINKKISGSYRAKRIYLLSGLIRCDECGKAYSGNTTSKKHKNNIYSTSWYQCSGRNRLDKCENVIIRAEKLEHEVLKVINEKICNSVQLDILLSGVLEAYQEIFNSVDDKIKKTTNQLNSVNKTINNYVLAIGNGLYSEQLKLSLENSEKSKILLTQKLQELTNIKNINTIDKEKIISETKNKFKGFSDKSKDYQKELIKELIKDIKITRKYAEISFNLLPEISRVYMAENERITIRSRIDINKLI